MPRALRRERRPGWRRRGARSRGRSGDLPRAWRRGRRTTAKALAGAATELHAAAEIDGLGRDDELDRGEARQAVDDVMRLLDHARRHRRIVLDAVGDRGGHARRAAGRDGGSPPPAPMPSSGRWRSRCARRRIGVRKRGSPEKPGDISLAMRKRGDGGRRATAPGRGLSKASAVAVVSKLTVDISSSSATNTAGLSPAPSRSASDRRCRREPSWSKAAPLTGARQRNDSGSCTRRGCLACAKRAAGRASDRTQLRGLGLAGRGSKGHGARIDRREVGAGRLERQSAGQRSALAAPAGIVQRERALADAVGIGVQQRDRVLGAEDRRFDAGLAERLAPRHDAAAKLRLPLADQRQEKLGHGLRSASPSVPIRRTLG